MLNKTQCEFLGLVSGAMEMAYFNGYFGSLRLDSGSTIALLRDDGVLLASFPNIDPVQARSAKPNMELLEVIGRAKHGIYEGTIVRDGVEQLIVARKLAQYPFVIAATQSLDQVLAEWRSAAIYIAVASGLLIAVIGIVVYLGIRQVRNYVTLVRAQADQDQKAQLDAAINNMPQGLVMMDDSERMVLCNRRYIEMYGLSPEIIRPGCTLDEMILHRFESGTLTGDRPTYLPSTVTAAPSGSVRTSNSPVAVAPARANSKYCDT